MSQFKLYLVRHAETVANRNKVLQGHIDFPLTEEGQAMALSLGEFIGNKAFHLVYSSDLGRAHTTLQLASSKFPIPLDADVQLSHLVREVSYGIFEGLPNHLTIDEVKSIRASERGVKEHEIDDDRESMENVLERQDKFVNMVFEDIDALDLSDEPKNVLCVSHGGYIKRFLEQKCGVKLKKKISNCSTSIVTVTRNPDGSICFHTTPDLVDLCHQSSHIP